MHDPASIDALLPRYLDVWARLGVHAGAAMPQGMALLDAYADMNRHYHSLSHLADVLEKLDWAKEALARSGELPPGDNSRMFDLIELALFYHDAVYDAKARDNEAQSRDLFIADARSFGLPTADIETVARLIDVTADHGRAAALDEKILCDCDLAILGAEPPRFAAYNDAIRAEYRHVPAAEWNVRRAAFLKSVRERPLIYQTEAFQQRYDAAARHNLAALLPQKPKRGILGFLGR
jgi:predicted metal-dependent HD superfamily phosphohydrolase